MVLWGTRAGLRTPGKCWHNAAAPYGQPSGQPKLDDILNNPRLARPQDADAIARVHVDSWRETYYGVLPDALLGEHMLAKRQDMWRGLLNSAAPQPVFVSCQDDVIVGFAAGGAPRSETYDRPGELYAIYLLRAAQGAGLGRALFQAVADDLGARGLTPFVLWVFKDNPAGAFYRHLGGRVVGEKIANFGGRDVLESAYLFE